MGTPTQVAPTTTTARTPATTRPPEARVDTPQTSGAVDRERLRAASYEEGAQALAPPPEAAQQRRSGYAVAPSEERGRMRALDTGIPGMNRGGGTRRADRPDKEGKIEAQALDMKTLTGVPEPDLGDVEKKKSIAKGEVTGRYGTYAGYDVASGEVTGGTAGFEGTLKSKGGKESVAVEGPNATYQRGAIAKTYAGMKGETAGKEASGQLEAYGKGYAGLSGKAGLNLDAKGKDADYGATAEGALGAGLEVGAVAKGDLKTPGLKVAGVEKDLDVGLGGSGTAKAYLKAGMGGGAYLTKEKTGIEGRIGLAAAAEAKGELHANIGPLGAKGEVGVLAGLGIGAEGGILYEDGKLVIGGRAYAALGYGVTSGVSVTIDLKQSYQLGAAILAKARDLGIEGAKAAYKAADADNDGKLSMNDAATHAAGAMDTGAKKIEHSVDGAIAFLDGDGDKKFDFGKDMGARVDQAKEGAKALGDKALARGADMVDAGKKAVGKAYDRAHALLDVDKKDGVTAQDAIVAYERGKAWAGEKIAQGAAWAAQKKDEASAWGEKKLDEAAKIAQLAYRKADRSGDQDVDVEDLAIAGNELCTKGKDAAAEGMQRAGTVARRAGKAIYRMADRDQSGTLTKADAIKALNDAKLTIVQQAAEVKQSLDRGYEAAKQAARDGVKAAYDAADLNDDKKVDAIDAALAVTAAKSVARATAALAESKAAAGYAAAKDAAEKLEAKARATLAAAEKAVTPENLAKVGSAAKKAIVDGATSAYESAADSLSRAGDTLATGYGQASERASAAWGRLTTFMRGG